jgi:hypothetical protein
MRSAHLISISEGRAAARARDRRVDRAISTRRRLREAGERRRGAPRRRGGRAWINGREVGGTDPRFEQLARGSD